MACKTVLISFEIKKYKQYAYNEDEEFDFAPRDAQMNEGVQIAVSKIYSKIKECVSRTIASEFSLARNRIMNMNNFLHIATSMTQSFVVNDAGRESHNTIVLTCKFYAIPERGHAFRIMLDIEHMPCSKNDPDQDRGAWSRGFQNEDVTKLKDLLDDKFDLDGRIEYMPIIKRGRLDTPCFLVSSDGRIMEYDFESTLFHKKSEFQDVKIVNSQTLGKVLLLDNLQNLAEADMDYTRTLMDRGYINYHNKEILILGGGDGGLLWELIKEDPKMITMAEIDPTVIDACREHMYPFGEVLQYMRGKTHEILVEDCMLTLRRCIKEAKKYDFIFNDLTDLPVTKREESHKAFDSMLEQKDSPWHFIEGIFNLSMFCLKEGGYYMTHTTGKGNRNALLAFEEFLKQSRFDVELEKRNVYVPSFMEYWVFYSVKKIGLKKGRESEDSPTKSPHSRPGSSKGNTPKRRSPKKRK